MDHDKTLLTLGDADTLLGNPMTHQNASVPALVRELSALRQEIDDLQDREVCLEKALLREILQKRPAFRSLTKYKVLVPNDNGCTSVIMYINDEKLHVRLLEEDFIGDEPEGVPPIPPADPLELFSH